MGHFQIWDRSWAQVARMWLHQPPFRSGLRRKRDSQEQVLHGLRATAMMNEGNVDDEDDALGQYFTHVFDDNIHVHNNVSHLNAFARVLPKKG